MDDSTRKDRMIETSLDGTWTMIMGDEEADPDQNAKIIVAGDKARNAETNDAIGTCSLVDGLMTITLQTDDEHGRAWPEVITARVVEGRSLSGTVHASGPDGLEFSDPCMLIRDMDLHAKPKAAWTQAGDFINAARHN